MLPDLALWLALISSNYPCLKHIFMVQKVFEPLKFDCISNKQSQDEWVYLQSKQLHFYLHFSRGLEFAIWSKFFPFKVDPISKSMFWERGMGVYNKARPFIKINTV